MKMERKIIFLLVFFATLIPFLVKFPLPVKATKIVQNIYDKIEEVGNKHGTVLMSFDFDPASKAELEPMARAVLKHLFSRGGKVVAMGHWNTGVGMAEEILSSTAKEYNKEYGKDWAFLGWKTGTGMLVLSMGQDFRAAFPKDARGNDVSKLEVTHHILTLKSFDYLFDVAAGSSGVEMWVQYGQTKYNLIMGAGVTAVMAPDYYPFLQSGQLNGMMGGLVGAAQYEALIGQPWKATEGMKPQSVVHIMLILLIVVGNIVYFSTRNRQRKVAS